MAHGEARGLRWKEKLLPVYEDIDAVMVVYPQPVRDELSCSTQQIAWTHSRAQAAAGRGMGVGGGLARHGIIEQTG